MTAVLRTGGASFDASAFKCAICLDTCTRPVTAPCQHSSCLQCFTKWVHVNQHPSCPTCRRAIPRSMVVNPRINGALVLAIRHSVVDARAVEPPVSVPRGNEDRPESAYTTERAQRAGLANAASGRIFVTVPPDHFGPIPASADPTRQRGVLVGDTWADRLTCRQWGAHLPHVAGIAGQIAVGAQSVALSGGYEDDVDNGDWFVYSGSGGRDLTGNKRTTSTQSFDQQFDKLNGALQ